MRTIKQPGDQTSRCRVLACVSGQGQNRGIVQRGLYSTETI